MQDLTTILGHFGPLASIIETIIAAQGVPYLVGGAVRDLVLELPIKDIDIEVHQLTEKALESCLRRFGVVRTVGKQFGVLRIDGVDVDFSLPRTDSAGRKPHVVIDPDLGIERALRRRDVTINAMALDLKKFLAGAPIADGVTQQAHLRACLVDPYGGYQDIQDRILRAIDPDLFVEDPLRLYRVMQFIGRFEMYPDEVLQNICKTMDIRLVSTERVGEEFRKLFLCSRAPSRGIRWLQAMGRLHEILPEISALIGVYQRADYHPEGDVFEHTMQALDAAAGLSPEFFAHGCRIACQDDETVAVENKHKGALQCFNLAEHRWYIILAALCHDVGKAVCSDAQGHAHGHEIAGVPLAERVVARFHGGELTIRRVKKLVRYHLCIGQFLTQNASVKAYRRLAVQLAPEVSMQDLGVVTLCDHVARNPAGGTPLPIDVRLCAMFEEKLKEASIERGLPKPLLHGRDIQEFVLAGPLMGKLLRAAYRIQIDESIDDREVLRERVKKMFTKK